MSRLRPLVLASATCPCNARSANVNSFVRLVAHREDDLPYISRLFPKARLAPGKIGEAAAAGLRTAVSGFSSLLSWRSAVSLGNDYMLSVIHAGA